MRYNLQDLKFTRNLLSLTSCVVIMTDRTALSSAEPTQSIYNYGSYHVLNRANFTNLAYLNMDESKSHVLAFTLNEREVR